MKLKQRHNTEIEQKSLDDIHSELLSSEEEAPSKKYLYDLDALNAMLEARTALFEENGVVMRCYSHKNRWESFYKTIPFEKVCVELNKSKNPFAKKRFGFLVSYGFWGDRLRSERCYQATDRYSASLGVSFSGVLQSVVKYDFRRFKNEDFVRDIEGAILERGGKTMKECKSLWTQRLTGK